MCVSVCVRTINLNGMVFDIDLLHDGLSCPCLGQVHKLRSLIKCQGHRNKNIAKVVATVEGFCSVLCHDRAHPYLHVFQTLSCLAGVMRIQIVKGGF